MENVTLAYLRTDVVVRMRRLGAGAVMLGVVPLVSEGLALLRIHSTYYTTPVGFLNSFSLGAALAEDVPGMLLNWTWPVVVWIFCGVVRTEGWGGVPAGWKKKWCFFAAIAYAVFRTGRTLGVDFGTYAVSRGRLGLESLLFNISSGLNVAAQVLWLILSLAALLFMLRVCALAGWRKMGVVSACVVGLLVAVALVNLGMTVGRLAFGFGFMRWMNLAGYPVASYAISFGILAGEVGYWAAIGVMAFVAARRVRQTRSECRL